MDIFKPAFLAKVFHMPENVFSEPRPLVGIFNLHLLAMNFFEG